MGVEIERKFLISKLPDNIDDYEYHLIEQAYLTTDPVIRIRKEDDNYYLTYKGKGLLAREEYNLPITKEAYDTLIHKADGNIISKKRVLIPYDKHLIELDMFDEPFAPLILAEVEFSSIEDADSFVVPEWFSEDVTNDTAYHNSTMSRQVFKAD
ncbi:MAG: CYTH domain-containing protein [Lachnospiraceae bacterium]|nr:CYTH domain-containing protein [Lachnospiraceae bacterium]